MAQTIDSAKRVINGTYGSVWKSGRKICECYGAQLKISKNKTTINLCGQFMEDTKAISGKGTGSLMLYHVDSEFAKEQENVQDGVDNRYTIISALDDPDSYGAERVAVYNVSFDDLTLADWQAATHGKVTAPFTFSKAKFLDAIESQ